MKLLPLLWLLCGLLLVVADQDPPVASTPKAPIAVNATAVKSGNVTSAAAGATGIPIAEGLPGVKAQTNNQSPTKATKIEQQPKEAEKAPAVPENVAKNRKRTDTDNPKPAGNATVTAATPKPVGVESKPSTPAAAAAAPAAAPAPASAPAPAASSSKPNANDTKAAKTATTNTAKPTAGSPIVSEGQSMKDVTKANNATGHLGSNNSTIITTTVATKTTSKTTPKPTKPPVVYSMDTHTEWEEKQEQGKAGDKLPLPKPASTLADPVMPQVQELTGTLSDRGDTSYVVPIVTVLLTVPLAIGVVTIMYRRFRDMWSTRHYRRMDFLVDGMYND
ncbi:uncharacterized protein LOC110181718 [Drosophila serrata]|uniref:uncharacterized protein LOC110181718 n=1 Tax=Drosophila serrata TaxID=7274 RepID=UPI000A1D03F9|nr:uncharacterized protein LOC110181718 [Drosophila serrata]